MALLRLEGVRKAFGANVVLHALDLSVAQGQCVDLIRASGPGKSTLRLCVGPAEAVAGARSSKNHNTQ